MRAALQTRKARHRTVHPWTGRLAVLLAAGTVVGVSLGTGTLFSASVGAAPSTSAVTVTRIGGKTPADTAATIWKQALPECFWTTNTHLSSAVVATATSFPDALAASYTEGLLGTGLLLTTTSKLPTVTVQYLQGWGITKVYVIGGPAKVSAAVVDKLKSVPVYTCVTKIVRPGVSMQVTRIYTTKNKYTTVTNVALSASPGAVGAVNLSGAYSGRYNQTAGNESSAPAASGALKTAIIATNKTFQDALATSVLSYGAQLPILLTTATHLSGSVGTALHVLGIQQAIVAGGPLAVSATVVTELTSQHISSVRVAGETYVQTAVDVAELETAAAPSGLGWSGTGGVVITLGNHFTDGLAGAALCGDPESRPRHPEPLLLTTSPTVAGSALTSFLHTAGTTGIGGKKVTKLDVLGGPLAVTTTLVDQLEASL